MKRVNIELYKSEENEDMLIESDDREKPFHEGYSNSTEAWVNNVEGFVYILNDRLVSEDPEKFAENPPSERYIDILKGAALHYGLHVINHQQFLSWVPGSKYSNDYLIYFFI